MSIALAVVLAWPVASEVSVVPTVVAGERQVANESVTSVSLVCSPAGTAVGSHRVAVIVFAVARGKTVVLSEIDEGLLVVEGVRHWRAGMREGDVVATVIITSVHGVVHVLGDAVVMFVLRLPDWAESVGVVEVEWLEAGELGEDQLLRLLASAVWTDTEITLDFRANDGPSGGANGLLEASKIVIGEDAFLTSLLLGEHRVDEEDGSQHFPVCVVDRLHDVAAWEERSHVRLLGEDFISDRSLGIANLHWHVVEWEVIGDFDRSLHSLVERGSEVGELAVDVTVKVGVLTKWVSVVVADSTEVRVLHEGAKSLGADCGGNASKCGDQSGFHLICLIILNWRSFKTSLRFQFQRIVV